MSSRPTAKPSILSAVEEIPHDFFRPSSWTPEDLYPAPLRPRKELRHPALPKVPKSKERIPRKPLKHIEAPARQQPNHVEPMVASTKRDRSQSISDSATGRCSPSVSESSILFSIDSIRTASSPSTVGSKSARTYTRPSYPELTDLFEADLKGNTRPRRPHIARSAPSYPPPTTAVPPVPKLPISIASGPDPRELTTPEIPSEHRRKRQRGERRARQALVVSSGEVVLTQRVAPKIIKLRQVPERSLSPSATRLSRKLAYAMEHNADGATEDFNASYNHMGSSRWFAGPGMTRSRTATTIMREAEEICRVFDNDRFGHVRKSWASGRGLMLSLGRKREDSIV